MGLAVLFFQVLKSQVLAATSGRTAYSPDQLLNSGSAYCFTINSFIASVNKAWSALLISILPVLDNCCTRTLALAELISYILPSARQRLFASDSSVFSELSGLFGLFISMIFFHFPVLSAKKRNWLERFFSLAKPTCRARPDSGRSDE